MAFVVDCSVTLAWFLADERTSFTDSVLRATEEIEHWVPAIWTLEFANGLLMAQRRKRIEREARVEALERVLRLGLHVDPTTSDMKSVSALAERRDLTTYDAAYLELAARRGFGLITLDAALAAAAGAEGVAVQAPGRAGAAQRRRSYNR